MKRWRSATWEQSWAHRPPSLRPVQSRPTLTPVHSSSPPLPLSLPLCDSSNPHLSISIFLISALLLHSPSHPYPRQPPHNPLSRPARPPCTPPSHPRSRSAQSPCRRQSAPPSPSSRSSWVSRSGIWAVVAPARRWLREGREAGGPGEGGVGKGGGGGVRSQNPKDMLRSAAGHGELARPPRPGALGREGVAGGWVTGIPADELSSHDACLSYLLSLLWPLAPTPHVQTLTPGGTATVSLPLASSLLKLGAVYVRIGRSRADGRADDSRPLLRRPPDVVSACPLRVQSTMRQAPGGQLWAFGRARVFGLAGTCGGAGVRSMPSLHLARLTSLLHLGLLRAHPTPISALSAVLAYVHALDTLRGRPRRGEDEAWTVGEVGEAAGKLRMVCSPPATGIPLPLVPHASAALFNPTPLAARN
jgi:hypothetical protein